MRGSQNQRPDNIRSPYSKRIVSQSVSNKIKQAVVNKTTNFSFSFGGAVSQVKGAIGSFFGGNKNKQIYYYIGGRKITSERQARDEIQKYIWMTYRKITGLSIDHNSDTGWGCLIRVGQMALAAALQRHFILKKIDIIPTKLRYLIITAFLQSGRVEEKYSLRKIVELAKTEFGLDYGSWFKPFQICCVLQKLHKSDPIKGAHDLKIIYQSQTVIYIADVLKAMGIKSCSCAKPRLNCDKCTKENTTSTRQSFRGSYWDQAKNQQPKKCAAEEPNKVLLFMSCRLGVNSIQPPQFEQLKSLMELQCCLGAIGGVPKKGYYFTGYKNPDQLVYLDPHIVQDEAYLGNLANKLGTFSTNQIKCCGRGNIDPSMALVFYIDSLKSLRQLQDKIEEIRRNSYNPIIIAEWGNQYNPLKSKRQSVIEEIEQEDEPPRSRRNSFIEEQ